MTIKTIFLIVKILIMVIPNPACGQDNNYFEGNVTVIKTSIYDTTRYLVQIKNDLLRLNEYKNNKLSTYALPDKFDNNLILVNPSIRAYTYYPTNVQSISAQNLIILKTDKKNRIHGELCSLWIVRDEQKNIEVYYWVTQISNQLNDRFLLYLNPPGNTFEYYLKIPERNGHIPILVIEKTLAGQIRHIIEVTEIQEKRLSNRLFSLPDSYTRVFQ